MNRYRYVGLFSLAATILLAGVASADLAPFNPPPRPPRPQPGDATAGVPFQYEFHSRAKTNRIIIPKKFLQAATTGKKVGQTGGKTRTVIAGLAISMALASLVLVGKRNVHKGVKAALLLAAFGVGTFALVQAASGNAPAPPPELRRPPVLFNGERVVIEVVDRGDVVRFIRAPVKRRRGTGSAPPTGASDGASAPPVKSAPPAPKSAPPAPNSVSPKR